MTNIEAYEMTERDTRFRKDLETLLNTYSRENASDTPDFILASFLIDCLSAFDKAVTARTQWYAPAPDDTPFGPAPPEGSGPTDEEIRQGEEDAHGADYPHTTALVTDVATGETRIERGPVAPTVKLPHGD